MKKYLFILIIIITGSFHVLAQPVFVEAITTDVSCNGDTDGTVLIRITGGQAPYKYSLFYDDTWHIQLAVIDTFYTFNAVSADNCIILVEDNLEQGFAEFGSAIVSEPALANISGEFITPISCFGYDDGELKVTAADGSGNYSYELNPGAIFSATGIYPNLSPGGYTITLTDVSCGTSVVSNTLTLTDPSLLGFSSQIAGDVSCNGDSDGFVHVAASGGTGTYTYTLNPGALEINSTGNFDDYPIGTYTVEVTDINSCPSATSSSIDIKEPAILAIASESFTQISCNGVDDGTVTITASGGTAPYSFTLNPGSITNTDGLFTGLSPDTYTLTLSDANLCGPVFSSAFDITEPDAIAISTADFTDINCNNANDGTIDITATGGTGILTYTLNPGAIDSNNSGSFTGLSAGSYTVNVSDPNSCPGAGTAPIIIANPDLITISSESETDITCNAANNGSISVTAIGGTGSLHYTLNPGNVLQTDNGNFTGLSPDSYTVTVTDDNTCAVATSNAFDITEPVPITLPVISPTDITCFGSNNGVLSVLAAGGTTPYQYEINPGGNINTDGIFTGLGQGTYSITVTDNNLCPEIFTDIASITEPPVLQLSLEKTDIQCSGDANGTITVTASGGSPGYEYSRNNIDFQASNIFSDLIPNTYNIWVRDINGCVETDIISINEPEELNIGSEFSISNNLCFGDSLGEIRILSVVGGVLDYLYSIDAGLNYVTTSDFQNLPAGNYQVMVKDANNCEASGSLININHPQEIKVLSYSYLDVSDCFGDATGQIAIEGTGGTGTKNYSLDGGETNTTGIYTSVIGGSHIISIRDANSCEIDTTVIINEPDELVFTGITLTDITGCSGDNNGIVAATATGGTGSRVFALDASAFLGSGTFISQYAGNYILHVKDDNNCQVDSSISLTEPLPLSIDSESATGVACAGSSDGIVSITASGGTAPYLFTLNPDAITNAGGSFNSLLAGDYTITVDDANTCGLLTSNILTVTEPPAIVVDSISSSEILCSGANNAEIHIYISGGTVPYQYSIDDGGTFHSSSDFVGLLPGTYHVSVQDANACALAIDTIDFVDPPAFVVIKEASTDIAACFGDSTGSAEFEVNGGTGSIEYSIDNRSSWQATGLYTNMPSGDYTIIAMDQNNCEISSSILTINQPPEITADITTTPARDLLTLGSISIANATGGTGSLEFSITGSVGPYTAQTDYPDLIAGFYDVVVRDANMCVDEETVEVIQIQPLDVTVSINHLSCNNSGDGSIQMTANDPIGLPEFSIDDSLTWSAIGLFENLPGGEYIIFGRDEDDRYFTDTIIVIDPVAIGIFSNITPATCSNLSGDGAIDITVIGASGTPEFEWSNGEITEDLNNIDAGSYWVNVIDENLCSIRDTIELHGITNVTADAGQDTSICFGESLVLSGQGGTTISWSPIDGLSNPNIANPIVETDTSISYTMTVVGLNDCFDIDSIDITVLPYLGLDAGNDTSVVKGLSYSVTTTGGPYLSYLWDPGTGVDDTTSANPTISPIASTNYIVSGLTEDGCYDRDTLMITLVENLVIYNAFSPNVDGRNDYWDIDNAEYYPDILVEVFNRWGKRIFSSVGYTDDKRWNGKNKGVDAPFGTYYYVVIPYKGATALTGPITIVR